MTTSCRTSSAQTLGQSWSPSRSPWSTCWQLNYPIFLPRSSNDILVQPQPPDTCLALQEKTTAWCPRSTSLSCSPGPESDPGPSEPQSLRSGLQSPYFPTFSLGSPCYTCFTCFETLLSFLILKFALTILQGTNHNVDWKGIQEKEYYYLKEL